MSLDHQAVLDGDRLALSRLLTHIENNTDDGQSALARLFPHTGQAHLVGITGAPGTGKSSLVNQLAYNYRHPADGTPPRSVAVIAVDPTSPFSGGAVLGDRIRMSALIGDPGVFIRSMASRGALGGLASATAGLVQAFDAAGYQLILVETVGAGQAEVDIARLAHTTIVVEAPGLGDDVQAIKAGILEIADILVVNKADRPGADSAERALRGMLELAQPAPLSVSHHGRFETVESGSQANHRWQPPILRTVATDGGGIAELSRQIDRHRQHLQDSGDLERRQRARLAAEFEQRLQQQLVDRFMANAGDHIYQQLLDQIVNRQLTPQQAVQALINGEEK